MVQAPVELIELVPPEVSFQIFFMQKFTICDVITFIHQNWLIFCLYFQLSLFHEFYFCFLVKWKQSKAHVPQK